MKRLYGIIGFPVAHSLSPVFQQAAFDLSGLDASYVPFALPPESLQEGLKALDLLGVSGFNVTLPHKEAVFSWVTDLDPVARKVGSVNTVVRRKEGWFGANTDVPGFCSALKCFLERSVGSEVGHPLVLGAGGSARSVVAGLWKMGFSSFTIVNRHRGRAESLVEFFRRGGMIQRVEVLDFGEITQWNPRGIDLVINTLSRDAFRDGFSLLDRTDLGGVKGFYDLSYELDGSLTPFLKKGEMDGVPVEDGIGMLLEQGALSFEWWTGLQAPRREMAESLYKRSIKKVRSLQEGNSAG
ncbi:MAG: shikimate dehydrogenase family protein [Leptospirales bacterium]